MLKTIRMDKIKQFLGQNHIYVLLAVVFVLMSVSAPNFLTPYNLMVVMKGMSLNALVAIGGF